MIEKDNLNFYPPPIDCKKSLEKMGLFLEKYLKKAKKKKFVMGLSGGIDSAVVAGVVCMTVGVDKLLVLKMPYKTSNPQSEKDADLIIRKYGMKSYKVEISDIVDSYFEKSCFLESSSDDSFYKVRKGNFMARIRMAILFDFSAKEDALVLGTGNKSEILLGYTTWYGDSASSINPIGNLYKSQVYQLADFIKIPKRIIKKRPSADLWAKQTDEKDMGIRYKEADPVLYLIFDKKMGKIETARILKIQSEKVDKILERVNKNSFKRKLPPIAKI